MNLATAEEFHNEIARLQAEIELLDAAHKASNSALLVIDSGFKNALAEIDRLRLAIRRLAGQDATLSVAGGSVTVEMDATLTPEEREAMTAMQEIERLVSKSIRLEPSEPLACVRLLTQLHDLPPGHIFTTTPEQSQILIGLGKAEPYTKDSA